MRETETSQLRGDGNWSASAVHWWWLCRTATWLKTDARVTLQTITEDTSTNNGRLCCPLVIRTYRRTRPLGWYILESYHSVVMHKGFIVSSAGVCWRHETSGCVFFLNLFQTIITAELRILLSLASLAASGKDKSTSIQLFSSRMLSRPNFGYTAPVSAPKMRMNRLSIRFRFRPTEFRQSYGYVWNSNNDFVRPQKV